MLSLPTQCHYYHCRVMFYRNTMCTRNTQGVCFKKRKISTVVYDILWADILSKHVINSYHIYCKTRLKLKMSAVIDIVHSEIPWRFEVYKDSSTTGLYVYYIPRQYETCPMLFLCWSIVYNTGPTSKQHRLSASCFLA